MSDEIGAFEALEETIARVMKFVTGPTPPVTCPREQRLVLQVQTPDGRWHDVGRMDDAASTEGRDQVDLAAVIRGFLLDVMIQESNLDTAPRRFIVDVNVMRLLLLQVELRGRQLDRYERA